MTREDLAGMVGVIDSDELPSVTCGFREAEMRSLGMRTIVRLSKDAGRFGKDSATDRRDLRRRLSGMPDDAVVVIAGKSVVTTEAIEAAGVPLEGEMRCIVGERGGVVVDRRRSFASEPEETVDRALPVSLRTVRLADFGRDGLRIVVAGKRSHVEPAVVTPSDKKGRTIVGLASYPARERGMLSVVAALSPQCDEMHVALNEYEGEALEQVLKKLSKYPNVHAKAYIEEEDLGCQNKFRGIDLCRPDDYFLTVDDDIVYPYDYVSAMLCGIDRNRSSFVSFHGAIFNVDENGVIADKPAAEAKNVITYRSHVDRDTIVDMPGTGVGGCSPKELGLSFDVFHAAKNTGDDELLAIWLRDHGKNGVCLRHKRLWLDTYNRIERTGALWRDQESASARISLLRRSGPWIHGRYSTPFFRIVIPVHNSTATLDRAISSIEAQTFMDYVVCVCDDHSNGDMASANRKIVERLGERGRFVENTGMRYAGTARNTAMALCTSSEYTLFLDADDTFAYNGLLNDLHNFIRLKGCPDVVVMPFINHVGQSTVNEILRVTSPKLLASCRFLAPWYKCVRSDLCPGFQEGLRRSNDVMHHFVLADTASTVVPFDRNAVVYHKDGETTMYGDKAVINGQSIEAVWCLIKVTADVLERTWTHEYMKDVIAEKVRYWIHRLIPQSIGLLRGGLSQFIRSKGVE